MPLPIPLPIRVTRRLAMLLLAVAAAAPAHAREEPAKEGVSVGKTSAFTKLVPAEQVEKGAAQQYRQMMQQAAQQNALAGPDHPQVQRLRAIAKKILPFAAQWNPRAAQWQWEVNLIGSKQINAFCMPGGKIAFYSGILDGLKLTDDEVAMVMGHEIAHALREHARERMGKSAATNIGANVISSVLGLGNTGNAVLGASANLLTLKFSRDDETEADSVGLELAARAGYDPRAGITLWRKMQQASKGAPPQWFSTHPASDTRVKDIERQLPQVLPLYQRASGKSS
ncbi:MAG: M48 family metallopeptidase [Burkholderiales bacterium]|nr:M48 family metallopeptidase [Burkholderiales bacterium]